MHSALVENTEAYTAYRGSGPLRARIAPRLAALLGRTAGRGRFRINFSQDESRLLTAVERITSPFVHAARPLS